MKYHVPTGFGFSPKASGFYPLNRYWKFRRRPMLHMRGAPQ